MNVRLQHDLAEIEAVLELTRAAALKFLSGLESRAVVAQSISPEPLPLPQNGLGAISALEQLRDRFESGLSGSAGSRYFGFVTGGVTPAALAGDWLTAVYDQNVIGAGDSIASLVELETLTMLRSLFGLPDSFSGSFVTGATMSNFVGLALALAWCGQQQDVDISQEGLAALGTIRVLSGTPHASVYKALSMLGIGRNSLVGVKTLEDREAVDVDALADALAMTQQETPGMPVVVVANAGTVNTCDFDALYAIEALRTRFNFWLHVDGAFGGFAACSPRFCHLVAGLECADSLTIDAHKWLNVPYDAAMQFTRHPDLQVGVFQNAAAYLDGEYRADNFVHLTPENSRRWRALPAWMTLVAYGRDGYREIVERTCDLAGKLGQLIDDSADFDLLAPVRLNGICFTLAGLQPGEKRRLDQFLRRVVDDGTFFLTPTTYRTLPALRISISSWRTSAPDIDLAWHALLRAVMA